VLSLVRKTVRHYRAFGLSSTAKVVWQKVFPPPPPPAVPLEPAATAVPANYGSVFADDARLDADARYALQVAKGYVSKLESGASAIKDKSVLELGPGLNLGTALILRSWGAREVSVADRFLVRFQPMYHPRLYRRISALLRDEEDWIDTEPLDRCAAANQHLTKYVTPIEVPLEKLGDVTGARFDFTLSNAVLEHVYHPRLAIRNLAQVSRPGSVGLHQVDCRDHRDFSRPLEYLLLDEFSFHELLTERNAEFGNRIRPDELLAMFDENDFDEVELSPNMWAENDYLEEFVPRLRAARSSPYSDIDVERLRPICGLFRTRMN
jgi:SAM-dependent methyltransferase